MTDQIHLISLGAGVQSSTMALMAAAGEIEPMPAGAIFADTQAEPASVYKWLDWLEKQLPFPVYRVTQGSLEKETLELHDRKDGVGQWSQSGIPAFLINQDGTKGQMLRQCTGYYKVAPIQRKVRELLKETSATRVVQWIGISLDEAHRMKPARVQYSTHIWPLIERRMTRNDCVNWMAKNGFPKPPRSACVFCPYHSDNEWRRLRDEEPLEFSRAVEFERKFREAKSKNMMQKSFEIFLHSSRVPLDQVDFRTDVERGQGLLDHWGNECEGMCGV
jgi:hypothetical protein